MFAYVEALHEHQLKVLQIIAKYESIIDNPKTPEETTLLVIEELQLKDENLALKLIENLYNLGLIVNFTRQDTWGIKVKFSLDGFPCHTNSSSDPVILTPKGRGYLQSHDLTMQIIQQSVNQANIPESEKPSLLKRAYDEVADKGIEFVAKLCAEVIYRNV